MLLISTAKIIAKSGNFVRQIRNVNKFPSNFSPDHVKNQAHPLLWQYRVYSSDSNDPQVETIYEGTLTKYMKSIKIFSLSTSVLALLSQPYLIPKVLAVENTSVLIGTILISGFFAIGNPVLLHSITGKYVNRLKYDSKNDIYTATLLTFFAQERQIDFTPDDVRQSRLRDIVTTCYIHDTPAFFDAQSFTDISHYSRIMGYDKPMDFQLEIKESKSALSTENPKGN